MQLQLTNNTTAPQRFSKTLAIRFWKYVDKNGPIPPHAPELGPCWVWRSHINEYGYGVIYAGTNNGKPFNLKAHQVAWLIEEGDIPHNLCILHKCDNPPCARRSHLWSGTHFENMEDMFSKQRHHRALTDDAVRAIRQRREEGETLSSIARDLSVPLCLIWRVCARLAYAHI